MYDMKQRVMSAAMYSTDVCASTLRSSRLRIAGQTFLVIVMCSSSLFCLPDSKVGLMRQTPYIFNKRGSSCDRNCYESKGHSEMGHSLSF